MGQGGRRVVRRRRECHLGCGQQGSVGPSCPLLRPLLEFGAWPPLSWTVSMTKLCVPPPPSASSGPQAATRAMLQRANLTLSFLCFPGPLYYRIHPSTSANNYGSPVLTPVPSHLPFQLRGLNLSSITSVLALPFSLLLGISFRDLGQVSCLQGRCIPC